MKRYRLLMLTTLIISGCSICYELIISAISSYLVGNSTLQYSITIGLYMSAMGLGSYLSKFLKNNLFNWFVIIEIGVGLIGGVSALILFLANLYLETYSLVMYAEIIIIGTFVGAEIPVLTRIIENDEENLRVTLSSIFSFDYIGGLVGSIAFPLIMLPKLGYFSTAFLTGTMNIIAATLIVYKYSNRIRRVNVFKCITAVSFLAMTCGMLFSDNISSHIEGGLYRDHVILSENSQYQHIVVTKHRDDLRLFLDGNLQFCSLDEYRYHEALIHIPMAKAKNKDKILILGGGDGLAVRELLKYENSQITLVDLDPEMIRLCSTDPNITRINQNAFKSDRLTVHIDDAYQFLMKNDQLFDVIIVDLPDPNNEALNKLYTNVFYRMCGNALTDDGIMNIQSTSPYYATNAFWCINKTLKSEGFHVYPYHLQVPSFGDWGFNLVSKKVLNDDYPIDITTQYLHPDVIPAMFTFAKDEMPVDNIEINRLSKPKLIGYYNEAIKNWQ